MHFAGGSVDKNARACNSLRHKDLRNAVGHADARRRKVAGSVTVCREDDAPTMHRLLGQQPRRAAMPCNAQRLSPRLVYMRASNSDYCDVLMPISVPAVVQSVQSQPGHRSRNLRNLTQQPARLRAPRVRDVQHPACAAAPLQRPLPINLT